MSKNQPAPDVKKLDFSRIESKDLKEARFPARLVGEYRVCLTDQANTRMRDHAATTSDVELCGVLVGEVLKDELGPYLQISDVIEGQAANNYGSQVTFTHDTWSHIHSIMDKEHPGKRIVGWYHTHPGFGVFLSGMDTFIQENFFNQPYQVAIVIETKQNELGCFAWKDGKCAPLPRLWVGQREVYLKTGAAEPFDPDAPAEKESRRESSEPEPSGWRAFGAGTLLLILIGCIVGWLLGRMLSIADMQRAAMESVQSEIYNVLEFASLNVAAGKDFNEVGQSLRKTEALLKDGRSAEGLAELQTAASMTDRLKETYKMDYTRFKQDMDNIGMRRRSLAQSVTETQERQSRVETWVADLYLMRIESLLSQNGNSDPASWSKEDQDVLKLYVARCLEMNPNMKELIKRHPRVLEFRYPEPGRTTTTTTVPAK